MPLDSGGVTHIYRTGDMDPADAFGPTEEPSLHYGPDIGAALKSAREFRGLSLQDVSDATRIRRTYLGAIEDMRLEELPSRPFTLGYIKAYAKHLGLDPEEAVNRFKESSPDPDEPLRAPVGVRRERDPRMGAIIAGGVLIVSAIVLWNIAQRAISEEAPPPPTAPTSVAGVTPAGPAGPGGPMSVGDPPPPPAGGPAPARPAAGTRKDPETAAALNAGPVVSPATPSSAEAISAS